MNDRIGPGVSRVRDGRPTRNDDRAALRELIPANHRRPDLLLLLACALGLLLVHSTRVGGVNLSLADALLLPVLIGLIAIQRLTVPPFVTIFFLTVIAISGTTAIVVTPYLFGVDAGAAVLSDILKMLVSFAYLICGIGLAKADLHVPVLRWFAFGASAVALVGIAIEVVGLPFLRETMYYAGTRFRGFMVDPNYWSVLAASAIAFLAWDKGTKSLIRIPLIVSLVVSVLMSGSKTGLITLAILFAILVVDRATQSRRKVEIALIFTGIGVVMVILWDRIMQALTAFVGQYVEAFPQLQRVAILIEDPVGAISEGGSGRSDTWESGITMIESSPLLGVGIGSYRAVNGALFGETTVAHNTYLQLAAEWGLPLATVFLAWMALLLIRATAMRREHPIVSDALVVRNMIIAFLIGSLSLSLNNARMFWLFLGILICLVYEKRRRTADGRGESQRTADDVRGEGS